MVEIPERSDSATVVYQHSIGWKTVGGIFGLCLAAAYGVALGLGVPASYYGLVGLGGLVLSVVVLLVFYKALNARARQETEVSFRGAVLTIAGEPPIDLRCAHTLTIREHQGVLHLGVMNASVLTSIRLEGVTRDQAAAAFDAPWFIEAVDCAPASKMTLTEAHGALCLRLIEEAGRCKAHNAAFAVWNAYPWSAPCAPAPCEPGTTPEALGEALVWVDGALGVSASYLFYREADAWRILPLGNGLTVTLEEGPRGLHFQSGTLMTYVFAQICASGVQARVCMEDSGAVNGGGSMSDSRRAFVSFVNSRTG